jgi:hypothetical protein
MGLRVFLPPLLASLLVSAGAGARPAASPPLSFSLFAQTGLQLGGIVWTGTRFIYVPETTGELRAGDVTGRQVIDFARIDPRGEETRCVHLRAAYGFARGLYCHTPDNRILRLSDDGTTIEDFARLPSEANASDGALAFDTGSKFGHALVAATGGSAVAGGEVYAVDASRSVTRIGSYSGPGGAENVAIAPAGFGPVSSQLLLTIDDSDHNGRLLAMAPNGSVSTLLSGLAWGLNPIAVLTRGRSLGAVRRGLYLADWETRNVYFLPGEKLRPYLGRVLVGTERDAHLYVVRYRGGRYRAKRLTTNLSTLAPSYNLEGALFLDG